MNKDASPSTQDDELKSSLGLFDITMIGWVGIGAGLALALTLYNLSPTAWISALVWFGLGAAVYFGYSRHRQSAEKAVANEPHD